MENVRPEFPKPEFRYLYSRHLRGRSHADDTQGHQVGWVQVQAGQPG